MTPTNFFVMREGREEGGGWGAKRASHCTYLYLFIQVYALSAFYTRVGFLRCYYINFVAIHQYNIPYLYMSWLVSGVMYLFIFLFFQIGRTCGLISHTIDITLKFSCNCVSVGNVNEGTG